MRAPVRIVLLAALMALVLPGVSHGQGSGRDQGFFAISPARRNVVGRPPATLVPTRVSNTTRQAFAVRAEPVLLSQDLSGAYTFSETPPDLASASKILSVSPVSFTLAPGEARSVAVRWTQLPLDTRAGYVGVLFIGRAQAPRGNRPLNTIQRLLNVNFLRLPGTYHPNGRFTRLRAEQGAPQVLRFTPRASNTGDVIAAPRKPVLTILDSTGKVAVRQNFRGPIILPTRQVDVPIDVRKALPKGDYTAIATMRFGRNRHARIVQRFRLVGPNQLPTASVDLRNLQGEGEIGGDSHVTGTLHSGGTLAAPTAVRLDLFRVDRLGTQGARPIDQRRLTFSAIAPGKDKDLRATYRKLAKGSYRVVATYRASAGATATAMADFKLTRKQGFLDRLRSFIRRHQALLLALLVLLVLAVVVGFFLRRQRRLQRELDASRAAAAEGDTEAAVVPAAAPGGGVDVNTATAAQLAEVAGLGPASAARIVAHRDEYGRFASLDELARVEGFDAERVDGLRGALTARPATAD